MNSPRLFRTTAFKLSLGYAVLYGLLAAVALSLIYWSTSHYTYNDIDSELATQTADFVKIYNQEQKEVAQEITRRRRQTSHAARSSDVDAIVPKKTRELREAVERRSVIGPHIDRYYLLTNSQGVRLAGNLAHWPTSIPQHAFLGTIGANALTPVNSTLKLDRAIRVTVHDIGKHLHLVVGQGLDRADALITHTATLSALTVVVILLAALGLGILMSRSVLGRIDAVNSTTARIVSGNLSERIPYGSRNDEFTDLAININAMLEQIERLMNGLRQVTNNVAHDLRSPLNRLRIRLEELAADVDTPEKHAGMLQKCIDDIDSLLKVFAALLSIAQADAGVRRNNWEDVNLSEIVDGVAKLYSAVTDEKDIHLVSAIEPGLYVRGNRQLLAQALSNVLDNAVKYTPRSGQIELYATSSPRQIVVEIGDSGPGIAAEHRERVLEPFARLDSARTEPGNGLGLSLVRAVARLHGATLELTDNAPGLKLCLKIPLIEARRKNKSRSRSVGPANMARV